MSISNTILYISPIELLQWKEEAKRFYLLDTLPGEHFERVHLPGAFNACVFQVNFLDQVRNIVADPADSVVVYDSSSRSMGAKTAAEKLLREGFAQVFVLMNGLEGWRKEGYPVDGTQSERPDDPQTLLELPDAAYVFEPEQCVISWTGRNPNTTHHGTVNLAGGTLTVTGETLRGAFGIDMQSIYNTNLEGDEHQQVLVDHLKSDDFFNVEMFPTAKYTINRARRAEQPFLTTPNYEIFGSFELCGEVADLSFHANLSIGMENNLIVNANFNIDRTLWGVLYGSSRYYEHLGMHMVFDLISIQLRIVGYEKE